jgi:hypothetical protein
METNVKSYTGEQGFDQQWTAYMKVDPEDYIAR